MVPNLRYMFICENMGKIVCGASDLKSDDRKYKQGSFAMKSRNQCDLAAYENATHIIMTCHSNSDPRTFMFDYLNNLVECREIWPQVQSEQVLETLLEGNPMNLPYNTMLPIWCVAMEWVNRILDEEKNGYVARDQLLYAL